MVFRNCGAELHATSEGDSGVWVCGLIWGHEGDHKMVIDLDCRDCHGIVECTVLWSQHAEKHSLETA